MLDPIAEMLTRIRNAQRAGHTEVQVSFSKLKLAIAEILKKEGFFEAVSVESDGKFDQIKIRLKYYKISNTQRVPAIQEIRRISREGQRVYIKKREIRNVKNKYGIAIISTSKGLMTDAESKKIGLGGEYVCEVW